MLNVGAHGALAIIYALKQRCFTNVFPLSAHHYNITLLALNLRLVRMFITQMITRIAYWNGIGWYVRSSQE